MSAGQHHRVTPGMPMTEHEMGRLVARRERRDARDASEPVMHLRVRDPKAWNEESAEWQRGYDGGWRSTL